jgi:ribosomal protein L31
MRFLVFLCVSLSLLNYSSARTKAQVPDTDYDMTLFFITGTSGLSSTQLHTPLSDEQIIAQIQQIEPVFTSVVLGYANFVTQIPEKIYHNKLDLQDTQVSFDYQVGSTSKEATARIDEFSKTHPVIVGDQQFYLKQANIAGADIILQVNNSDEGGASVQTFVYTDKAAVVAKFLEMRNLLQRNFTKEELISELSALGFTQDQINEGVGTMTDKTTSFLIGVYPRFFGVFSLASNLVLGDYIEHECAGSCFTNN